MVEELYAYFWYAYGPITDTDTHTGCTYAISEKYAAGTIVIR